MKGTNVGRLRGQPWGAWNRGTAQQARSGRHRGLQQGRAQCNQGAVRFCPLSACGSPGCGCGQLRACSGHSEKAEPCRCLSRMQSSGRRTVSVPHHRDRHPLDSRLHFLFTPQRDLLLAEAPAGGSKAGPSLPPTVHLRPFPTSLSAVGVGGGSEGVLAWQVQMAGTALLKQECRATKCARVECPVQGRVLTAELCGLPRRPQTAEHSWPQGTPHPPAPLPVRIPCPGRPSPSRCLGVCLLRTSPGTEPRTAWVW